MTAPLKVHGVDLSHHNPNPDLKRAKAAGLLWLYHKCTEGNTVRDQTYKHRRALAKEAGLPFGAYHFARPDANGADAKLEAQYFMEHAAPVAGDLVPVLDFEVSHPQAKAWAKTFMREVERLLKLKGLSGTPMHYGPDDFGDDYAYLRWVPRYSNSNARPERRWDIHQFSDGNYGVPNHFPGVGKVDLNTMRNGLSLSDFRLTKIKLQPGGGAVTAPAPVKKPKETRKLRVGHASMQFSDPTPQQRADVKKLFKRAVKKNLRWITGTEAGAGSGKLRQILKNQAKKHGYRFHAHPGQDCWIAVKESFIVGNCWEPYWEKVIDGKAGKHTSKGVMSITFDTKNFGRITVIAAHYITKGRPAPGETRPAYRVNLDTNKLYAKAIGDHAKKMGKGSALVFFGGDMNIVDKHTDVFFGQPLDTVWDELEKWPNTGHGNIDVIANFRRDGRVDVLKARAFNDKQFFLHTDHFYIEAVYEVRML